MFEYPPAFRQRRYHLAQDEQSLVDGDAFFCPFSRGLRLSEPFAPRQIDQCQLRFECSRDSIVVVVVVIVVRKYNHALDSQHANGVGSTGRGIHLGRCHNPPFVGFLHDFINVHGRRDHALRQPADVDLPVQCFADAQVLFGAIVVVVPLVVVCFDQQISNFLVVHLHVTALNLGLAVAFFANGVEQIVAGPRDHPVVLLVDARIVACIAVAAAAAASTSSGGLGGSHGECFPAARLPVGQNSGVVPTKQIVGNGLAGTTLFVDVFLGGRFVQNGIQFVVSGVVGVFAIAPVVLDLERVRTGSIVEPGNLCDDRLGTVFDFVLCQGADATHHANLVAIVALVVAAHPSACRSIVRSVHGAVP